MAKFIKSKFKVLWGTVFAFFYGFFASDVIAQEDDTGSEEVTEEVEEKSADGKELSPGAIAAAVAAAAALIGSDGDGGSAPAPVPTPAPTPSPTPSPTPAPTPPPL